MKILVISDFGGSFPDKTVRDLKQGDFDIVLSPGDFADIKAIRKLFLKYGDRHDEVYLKMPKSRREAIRRKRFTSTKIVLKKLNSLGRPVYLVSGNNEIWEYESFANMASGYKNLKLMDGKVSVVGGIAIIGNRCEHTTRTEEEKGVDDEDVYDIQEKFLQRALSKYAKVSILMTHYPPYGCKLDKLPKTNPLNPGIHIGSHLIRWAIKKYQPPIAVCGHLEEYQDKCRIGKTIILNPGEGGAGKYAILTIDKNIFSPIIEFSPKT